jgi:transposase
MQAVYGDQYVDVSTVRCWVRQFEDGGLAQADLSDETRSGRPVTAIDHLYQDRIEELICGNCRIKEKEIAVALGIFKERVGRIIGVLEFRKFCARWVPRMLSGERL